MTEPVETMICVLDLNVLTNTNNLKILFRPTMDTSSLDESVFNMFKNPDNNLVNIGQILTVRNTQYPASNCIATHYINPMGRGFIQPTSAIPIAINLTDF